jgi:hypothetical protein
MIQTANMSNQTDSELQPMIKPPAQHVNAACTPRAAPGEKWEGDWHLSTGSVTLPDLLIK